MTTALFRYLGFAFAAADLLMELDAEGQIVFAAGAAGRLIDMDAEDLNGRNWRELIAEDDRPLVDALLSDLETGARRGPVALELARSSGNKPAMISLYLCRLPQLAPAISCAISGTPAQASSGAIAPGGAYRLHDAGSFDLLTKGLAELSAATGIDLDIAFVELNGLAALDARDPVKGAKLLRSVAGTLRADSYGGMSAARLGDERFAVVRERHAPDRLIDHVDAARLRSGIDNTAIKIDASAVALDTGLISNEKMLRALRYALNNFIEGGLTKRPAGSLGDVFQQQVQETMDRAGTFTALVDERKFKLAYQPIVELKNGKLHHHEVLVRFSDDVSPFGMIRMAEELDLVSRFDMAMVEAVIARLNQKDGSDLRLAVNMSGRSLMSPDFHEALMRILTERRAPRERLIFEVTESAALTDLNLADRHIQALRGQGFHVCLDDFGSGAASFPYLKMLTVDSVKIDGQYIRELTSDSREGEMIRHLVNMCRSLKVHTTAEMVEDLAVAELLKEIGVDYGQGYFFGRPQADPSPPEATSAERKGPLSMLRARRSGKKTETWS